MFHLGILPLIAMALISGITAAVSGAAKIIPGPGEDAQNTRRKLLLDNQTAGTLGLTPKQIQDLTAIGMSPVQTMAKEDLSRRGDLMSTLDMGAGSSLIQADLAKEATRKQALAVGIDIARQNLDETHRQEAEIERLQAAKQARTKEQVGAAVETAASIATAANKYMTDKNTADQEAIGTAHSGTKWATPDKWKVSDKLTAAERSADYQALGFPLEFSDQVANMPSELVMGWLQTYYKHS